MNTSAPEQAKKESPEPKPKAVPYLQLFRYTTRFEKLILVISLLFAAANGCAAPLLTFLYMGND